MGAILLKGSTSSQKCGMTSLEWWGRPPLSVLIAPQHPPKDQGVNQICGHVQSIIQGGAHVVQCTIKTGGVHFFSSHDGVVWSLIGVNIAVFFLWRHADRRFMENNFKISVDNFLSGRVHTLLTCAFSHIMSDHLLSNMIGLYFFGSAVGSFLGAEYLLKLYLAGALGGSIMFLINQAFIVPWLEGSSRKYYNPRYTPGALGASGAVNAIILLDIFLFPKAIHYLNFFIPVPAMLLGAIIIGRDLWMVKQGDTQISGAAHLGGALVAALAWAKIKRPWI